MRWRRSERGTKERKSRTPASCRLAMRRWTPWPPWPRRSAGRAERVGGRRLGPPSRRPRR
eukprot:10207992-Alexandrium_andersonii.AAC.1